MEKRGRKKAERKILLHKDKIAKTITDKYLVILNSIDEGFAFCELIRDKKGQAVDFRYLEFNSSFEKQRGLKKEHFIGRTKREIYPNLDPWWVESYQKVVDNKQPLHAERFFDNRWFEINAYPFGGNYFSLLLKDITKRKTEDLLFKEEGQLQSLSLKAAKMGLFEWSSDGQTIKLSPESQALFGLNTGQFLPISDEAYKLLHPEDVEKHIAVFKNARIKGEDYYNEFRVIRPVDGRIVWIAEKGNVFRNLDSGITTVRGVHWDITEKKNAHNVLFLSEKNLKTKNAALEMRVEKGVQDLAKFKVKRENEILNAVIFAQEKERARIGEGLHNGVAQLLYAVQNNLQLMQPEKEKDRQILTSATRLINEAIADTRRISFELMPPVLKDYGLKVAIETLVMRVFVDRMAVKLKIILAKRLPEHLEISIYRLVQEIFNNIIKHSQATLASLELFELGGNVVIKISDNGIGFSVKTIRKLRKGIGLEVLNNRVKLLEGHIKYTSKPEKGTTVEIKIPLQSKAS